MSEAYGELNQEDLDHLAGKPILFPGGTKEEYWAWLEEKHMDRVRRGVVWKIAMHPVNELGGERFGWH